MGKWPNNLHVIIEFYFFKSSHVGTLGERAIEVSVGGVHLRCALIAAPL